MPDISLHVPRIRRPLLSVRQVWLLLALACVGVWVGVVALVRHALR